MVKDGVRLKMMFRINIRNSDGSLHGDSGWIKNQITNEGFDDYLVRLLFAQADSKQLSYIALGTGSYVSSNDTQLAGEIMDSTQRKTFQVSMAGSKTGSASCTFASSDNFLSASVTLNNIGLYNSSNAGTLGFGNAFASSTLDTNQNVEVTYSINFAAV